MTDVKVVASKGNSAVVEYIERGKLQRKVVPHSAVKDNAVSETTLKNGAPYGASLSGLKLSTDDLVNRLEDALHRRGVWTVDDFKRNPTAVQSALQLTLNLDVSAVLNYAADLE